MAKQLIYTAKNIKADEALRIGLVNAVYPLAELMPAAEKLAETIAKNAPIAVRACRRAWALSWKSASMSPIRTSNSRQIPISLINRPLSGLMIKTAT